MDSPYSILGVGQNVRIGRSSIWLNQDTGMFRSPEACRIHHLLDSSELHKDAELFSSISGKFPRVDDYLVPACELSREMGKESFFDASVLSNAVDKSKNALAADEIEDEPQQSVRQGLLWYSNVTQ